MKLTDELKDILDLARWAPSGDNVQSWEFEIAGPRHVVVHTRDTRIDTVYDLRGRPSQLAYGILLETLAIAASAHGLRAAVTRRPAPSQDEKPEDKTAEVKQRNAVQVFDVRLEPDPSVVRNPLIDVIKVRSVQRRPMERRPLTAMEKDALVKAVGAGYSIDWYETPAQRWAAARLMYKNAKLRLTMPEAFLVHKHIIDWEPGHEDFSDTLVPPNALGVDKATLRLMKWAMASWGRMSTMNAVFGTWAARLQMDLLPGLACAAHYVIRADKEPVTVEDYLAAGAAVQRFWLTVTRLGLQMQPEMTPLIFSRYVEQGPKDFTNERKLIPLAQQLRKDSMALLGKKEGDPFREVYMGRVGAGKAATARSRRKELDQLIRQ